MMDLVAHNGNKKVVVHVRKIDENTRRGIRQGFFRLGSSLRKTASDQVLKRNKTGRLYRIRRGSRIRNHRASAAGESPANLSGTYRRGLDFKIRGFEEMAFGNDVIYAKPLEIGRDNMEPRPGLGNAVDVEERNSVKYFESEISRNLKR